MIHGWHIHRTSRIRRRRIHWTHKQHRSTHQIHHQTWERKQTSLHGSMHPYSEWWIHEDNYLHEADTHGPVPQLQVTSPSNPQTFSCTHPSPTGKSGRLHLHHPAQKDHLERTTHEDLYWNFQTCQDYQNSLAGFISHITYTYTKSQQTSSARWYYTIKIKHLKNTDVEPSITSRVTLTAATHT